MTRITPAKAAPELLAQLKDADQLLARCSSRVDPEHDAELWQDMIVNAETTRQLIERIEGPPPPITKDDLIF